MSTRAELRAIVEAVSKRPDKSTLIDYGLDIVLRDVCNAHNFREMKVETDLSASEDDVSEALPDAFHHLLEARLIDGTSSYKLTIKSKTWVVSRFPNIASDNSSKPEYAYEEGGNLYFSCPLNADYTIRITYHQLLAFADDLTENPIPCAENVLIFGALAWLYNAIEMSDRGAFWELKAGTASASPSGALLNAIRSDKRRVAEEKQLEEFKGAIEEERDLFFIVPDEV